jgi:hypothetical protein
LIQPRLLGVAQAVAALAALACPVVSCGPSEGEAIRATSLAIVAGAIAPTAASPVVLVAGPQGVCSGVLIAENLVATARHCAAQFTKGALICTPSGELAPGSPGGALGADYAPSAMQIYVASDAPTAMAQGTPDAIGAQILSTESPSGCRDDLSFIVLDRSLPVVPVQVRLDRPTSMGDGVSVWGYGQTMNASDLTALRVYDGAQIVGIGPSVATPTAELAPVRSVRVGTGAITCNGDSGGPILSSDTGALIATVSVGSQALPSGACAATGDSPTTGPQLSQYRDLVLQAFAAANTTPNLEPAAQDAGVDAGPWDAAIVEAKAPREASSESDSASDSASYQAGGSCSTSPRCPHNRSGVAFLVSIAVACILGRWRFSRSATLGSSSGECRSRPPAIEGVSSHGGVHAGPRYEWRRSPPCGARHHGFVATGSIERGPGCWTPRRGLSSPRHSAPLDTRPIFDGLAR